MLCKSAVRLLLALAAVSIATAQTSGNARDVASPEKLDVTVAKSQQYLSQAGDVKAEEAIYPAATTIQSPSELEQGAYIAKYVVRKRHARLKEGTYYVWVGKPAELWEGKIVDEGGKVVAPASVAITRHPDALPHRRARLLGKLANPHAGPGLHEPDWCCFWIGSGHICLTLCF